MPFDTASPFVTSGIRLGTPAGTSRGFGVAEFKKIGEMIVETLDGLAKNGEAGNAVGRESAVESEGRRTDRGAFRFNWGFVTEDPCGALIAAVSKPR